MRRQGSRQVAEEIKAKVAVAGVVVDRGKLSLPKLFLQVGEELIQVVARLFGYRCTTVNIRDRISEAISYLELYNRIQVAGGQIHALELEQGGIS